MRFDCESCGSPFATDDRSAARCPRCGGLLRPDARAAPSAEAVRVVEGVLDWYVAVKDEPVGPLGAQAVRARWEAGQVGPESLCWRPGLADWQPVAELRELHEYLRATAARPAIPAPRAQGSMIRADAGTGSGLSALAGAELASRGAAASQPALIDLLTAPHVSHAPARVNGAMTMPAAARAVPGPGPGPAPATSALPRRAPRLSIVGAFGLGAALAGLVALAALARQPRAPGDSPVAVATPPPLVAAAPTPAVPAAPAATAAAKPEPAVARAELAPSPAPVRASDPPAATPRPAAKPAPARMLAARTEPPASRVAPRAAARTAKPARAAVAPTTAGPKLAMAEPARRARAEASREPELPPTPAASADPGPAKPPATKTVPRDPLLDAVTDDELERELGGGAAKPAASPARASSPAVYVPPAQPGNDLPESVTPAQINEAVGSRVSALKGCIEEQRAGDPGAKGTLKVRWVIGGDGSVRDVKTLSSEYEGQPIARCVAGVVKGIRFPSTRTRGQEVVFPFKF